MNARFFRIEALWEIDYINEHGIVLNPTCDINEGCPGYNKEQGTLNITKEIFSPFKFTHVSLRFNLLLISS